MFYSQSPTFMIPILSLLALGNGLAKSIVTFVHFSAFGSRGCKNANGSWFDNLHL